MACAGERLPGRLGLRRRRRRLWSAACGSQVISEGCRLVAERRWQKGVGVATALLLDAGIPVVAQRDHRTLALLRARLAPGFTPPDDARDHH